MTTVTQFGRPRWRTVAVLTILAILAALLPGCAPSPSQSDAFPTAGWLSTTPEAQGLDSARLADALLTIRDKVNLHSLLVIRHGKIVADAYFYPYDGSAPHDLSSVTKSIMTTLIGIAVDQGKLKLDDPVLSFFPDATLANRSADMEKITAALQSIQQPPPAQPVPPQPAIAETVSGQTYELAPNPFGLTSVQMQFDDSAEAVPGPGHLLAQQDHVGFDRLPGANRVSTSSKDF